MVYNHFIAKQIGVVMKSFKSIVATLAVAITSYGFLGVATTTTNISSAHASSSFSKSLKRTTERNLKTSQRNIQRQINNKVKDAHELAVISTIGVASGGVLLTKSERRKLQQMQKNYTKNNHNQKTQTQTQYQPSYYNQIQASNKYQQYYLK